jgi:ABC-type Mn2+/Zn2+ transport system ATPase subunit
MSDRLLTLEAVTVGYARRAVLHGVNLALDRPSFTGLVGANGSGKSTLLKTILGILPPLAGKLVFHPIHGRAPILGYTPQRESLDPIFLLSSFEVALMGVCGRVGPGEIIGPGEREWVHHCLEQTGAAHLSRRLFSELSGGEKQRVLIARSLATKAQFLLLDEPTAGIDAATTRSILDLLQHIYEQQRQSILIVSHDLAAVREYTHQAIWLHAGRVWQGPSAELLNRQRMEQMMGMDLN